MDSNVITEGSEIFLWTLLVISGQSRKKTGQCCCQERCALAGDQVGQGHAVGCEAGKLCKLVDTVLKGGASASWQKHRNI